MDPNAQRTEEQNAPADAYWRRRFFALVGSLGVVGLLIWACSGLVGGKPASQTTGTGQAGKAAAAAFGSGAAASPTAKPGVMSPAPSATSSALASRAPASPTASPTRSAARAASPAPSASGTGGAKAAAGTCPAADIVLTLLPSKASYGPHARPTFRIDVVSTDNAICTFGVGPKSLRVVVTHGSQLAWNSGACLRAAASRVIQLRRGVPVVVPVGWNRHLNAGGCSASVLAASPRTYVAAAQSGAVESPGRAFRLK